MHRGDLRSHTKRCKKLHFLAGITDEPVAAFRGRVAALEMPIATPDFLNDMVRAKRFFCLLLIPGLLLTPGFAAYPRVCRTACRQRSLMPPSPSPSRPQPLCQTALRC